VTLLPHRSWLLLLLLLSLPGCQELDTPAPDAQEMAATVQADPAIRPEAAGLHGAVVAGHPLAAQAGYRVLREGGNATDAAVTMAAILAVVRPHMNGVGGDAFALFHSPGASTVEALNGSGRAAAGATPQFYLDRELEEMPFSGALAVTVPGAVSAWAQALERHGTRSLAEALEPAIELARDGFVVTQTLERDFSAVDRLNEAGQELYGPGGEQLRAGEVLRNPALARTLETIAQEGPEAMYGGAVGEALVRFLEAEGSPLRLQDFAEHTADWGESISIPFQGLRVHSHPPSSQGLALLQLLGITEAAGLDHEGPLAPDHLHNMIEATRIALADRDEYVADPRFQEVPWTDSSQPSTWPSGPVRSGAQPWGSWGGNEVADGDGDTVYLMVVDADGNAVSWIQSIFSSFGSQLVEPETGIVLQNRGAGFVLEEGHPNQVAPGKRPFHTLLPAMVTDGTTFRAALGTPAATASPRPWPRGSSR
jgi:gamma-glutamyltranspeptidase / glutathione hydrolase